MTNILALTLGFVVLLGLQYGTLWLTGKLFNPLPDPGFVPLSTIVAIQFVPLLGICAPLSRPLPGDGPAPACPAP